MFLKFLGSYKVTGYLNKELYAIDSLLAPPLPFSLSFFLTGLRTRNTEQHFICNHQDSRASARWLPSSPSSPAEQRLSAPLLLLLWEAPTPSLFHSFPGWALPNLKEKRNPVTFWDATLNVLRVKACGMWHGEPCCEDRFRKSLQNLLSSHILGKKKNRR